MDRASGAGHVIAVLCLFTGANVALFGRRVGEGFGAVALIGQAGGKGLYAQAGVMGEGQIASTAAQTAEVTRQAPDSLGGRC